LNKVYLSLGSNLGWKEFRLGKAIGSLRKTGDVLKVSGFHKTKPYGKTDQPDFVNCALELETSLSPEELLASIHTIEGRMGRIRTEKWGPRTIDIDIVFFGGLVIDTPELKIPHPDMQNRDFVLKPLMELCPDLVHPVLGKTVRELAEDLMKRSAK
jgi:2-amino-4-hydroxy-6-hydroxymethyldihydropteridine diphosphokinase